MKELILIFSYIVCAFIPVFIYRKIRSNFSIGMFWATWFFSITGAFSGGLFGTAAFAHAGLFWGFPGSILSGLLGAWLISSLFIRLKEIPGNW